MNRLKTKRLENVNFSTEEEDLREMKYTKLADNDKISQFCDKGKDSQNVECCKPLLRKSQMAKTTKS